MAFTLPALPYATDSLEAAIDKMTMEIHHGKHHNAYVTNLNNLTKDTPNADASLEAIIKSAPAGGLFNNAAQVWNHSFYWQCIKPGGGGTPSGALLDKINADFGSFEAFVEQFKAAGATQFGSGWAWLSFEKGKLVVESTPNQDSPLMEGRTPILGLDVWEHAYYLKYQNRRPDYLKAWWNVVNWAEVAKGY